MRETNLAGKLSALPRGDRREEKAMPFAMEVGKLLHGRVGRLRRRSARKTKVPENAGLGLSQYPKERMTEKEEV